MDGNNQQFDQQINPQGQPQYYQQTPGQAFDPFAMPNYAQGYPYVQQPAPFDRKGAKKHFSRVGLSYFLFGIAATLVQVIVSVVVDLVNPDLWDNYLFTILASILPMYLIGAPICMMLMKRVPAEKPEKAGWGFGKFIAALIIALGVMYIGSYIGTVIGLVIESFSPEATASTNAVQEMVLTGDMLVNIVIMVFIGPVVEELLFRKLLCDRLRIYGEGITVAVAGFMFGIFHGNLTQFVYAFLLGCILTYVYLKTGRVTITIAYHIIINFVGSVVPLLALRSADIDGLQEIMATGDNDLLAEFITENIESFAVYALYSMGIILLMVVGLILLIVFLASGKVKFRPGRYTIPSGKKFGVAIINTGMILFILMEIGEILINMFA
ncbi:MAG: CPBP family intramembrane metalloprotease [Lachnospiraceae bacterium]|nr:CPBP family intramembrane metalloprotease [Lachnospiraceae bacterium]MBP5472926.1 CPBP family intramembrane metalloprotease [Lachnospiraceae bacterium]